MQINSTSGISLFPSLSPTNQVQPAQQSQQAQATAAHREVGESSVTEATESSATQVAEGEAVKPTKPGSLSIYV